MQSTAISGANAGNKTVMKNHPTVPPFLLT